MQVKTYIPDTLDKVFDIFNYSIDMDNVSGIQCIAYEGIANDEYMLVYELYEKNNNTPRFFGVSHYDHSDGHPEKSLEVMKTWSKSSNIELLETDGLNFLFELFEPYGIRFLSES